jgi:hypothetical protein
MFFGFLTLSVAGTAMALGVRDPLALSALLLVILGLAMRPQGTEVADAGEADSRAGCQVAGGQVSLACSRAVAKFPFFI